MIIGICRNCRRYVHDHENQYHGFCSSWCCSDFAAKHDIIIEDAKDLNFGQEELKDQIRELEEKAYKYDECYLNDLENQVDDRERDIDRLEVKLKELKELDWEKIERERIEEENYIKNLEESTRCAELASHRIKEKNKKVTEENKLIHAQNIDLLSTIKEMRSYSDRFQQMDLDTEWDYDE